MGPMIWLYLVVLATPSQAIPYPVPDTTVFPGSGGCYWNYNMILMMGYGLTTGCHVGGDYQSLCIPLADGGHRCLCSQGYQLYSDGICKMKDPCGISSPNPNPKQNCESSGGICKVDSSTRNGFTCDCTGTSGYTDLYSNRCEIDPCMSNMPGSISGICRANNAVCTPHQGDASNGFPFSCQCPAPLIPVMNDHWRGGCASPCNSTDNPFVIGCENCVANASNPNGFSCKCNDPNKVYLYEPGFCYDPCKDPFPMGYNGYYLIPRMNYTDFPPGDRACKIYDPNAICYTSLQSPMFYECKCSAGYTLLYGFNHGNTTNNPNDIIDNIVTCIPGSADPCTALNPCGTQDPDAVCQSNNGSYTCQCSPGFTFSAGICARLPDPCSILNPCGIDDKSAVCKSSNGTYTCQCSSGFTLSGNICIRSPDPCTGLNPCGPEDKGAVCKSASGSYTCQCSAGFTLSNNRCIRQGTACQKADKGDGNPCNNNGDKNATCVATCSTTYTCKCSKGFWARNNTCVDSNECVNQINPCPNIGCGRREDTICRNTIGSYSCSCGDGTKCPCGTPAVCTTGAEGLKKCKCGADEYYYY